MHGAHKLTSYQGLLTEQYVTCTPVYWLLWAQCHLATKSAHVCCLLTMVQQHCETVVCHYIHLSGDWKRTYLQHDEYHPAFLQVWCCYIRLLTYSLTYLWHRMENMIFLPLRWEWIASQEMALHLHTMQNNWKTKTQHSNRHRKN